MYRIISESSRKMLGYFVENPRHLTLILSLILTLNLTLTFFVNHGRVSAAVPKTWRGCFSQSHIFALVVGAFYKRSKCLTERRKGGLRRNNENCKLKFNRRMLNIVTLGLFNTSEDLCKLPSEGPFSWPPVNRSVAFKTGTEAPV